MPKVKLTVDGIDHMVDEESVSLVKSLLGQRDAATKTLADKEAAHAAAVTKLTQDHAAELGKVRDGSIPRDQIAVLVVEHAALLDDARALCPKLDVKGKSSTDIRRAIIGDLTTRFPTVKSVGDAILAGSTLDKVDDTNLKNICNAVVASGRSAVQDEATCSTRYAGAFARSGDPEVDKKVKGDANVADDVPDMSEETFNRKNFQTGAKPVGK